MIGADDSDGEGGGGNRGAAKDIFLTSLREPELEVDGHIEPEYWWEELELMFQSRAYAGYPLERFVLRGRN